MLQNILSWFILFFQITPWIVVVGGLIIWFINRQTTNIKWKYLLVMSYLESMKLHAASNSEVFKGMLSVIQILIIAIVWKFAQIQSMIFYYQQIITENKKHSSGIQKRFFLIGGILITLLTIGIIEMIKFIL